MSKVMRLQRAQRAERRAQDRVADLRAVQAAMLADPDLATSHGLPAELPEEARAILGHVMALDRKGNQGLHRHTARIDTSAMPPSADLRVAFLTENDLSCEPVAPEVTISELFGA